MISDVRTRYLSPTVLSWIAAVALVLWIVNGVVLSLAFNFFFPSHAFTFWLHTIQLADTLFYRVWIAAFVGIILLWLADRRGLRNLPASPTRDQPPSSGR